MSYDVDEKSMDGQFFELGFTVAVDLRYADGRRRTGKFFVENDDDDYEKYLICPRD